MIPKKYHLQNDLMILGAIILCGLVLRTGIAVLVPSPLVSDYSGYWAVANNIYDGRGLVSPEGLPTAFLSPGYSLFLAAIFEVFGSSIAIVKVANIVLSLLSIFFIYRVTLRLFSSTLTATIASALFSVCPEAAIYTDYVTKENLMIFLVMAQLMIATETREGYWRFLNPTLFGIVTGCLAIVGNAALAMLPGMAILIFKDRKSLARAAEYAALAAAFAVMVTAPLLQRNHKVFGAYVLNNNGGFNLYIGNNPNATPFFQSIADTPMGEQWQALLDGSGEHVANVFLGKLAADYIISNPLATAKLGVRKALAFWTPPFHSGKTVEDLPQRFARAAWLTEYLALIALFIVTAFKFRTHTRQTCALWLMVVGYTGVHMIFYVIFRYRLPLVPVLCIGAALGFEFIRLGFVTRASSALNQPQR